MKLTLNITSRAGFTFESQVKQYPEDGPKGISYFAGEQPEGIVDCLLYRDKSGKVRGILNHYPVDFPPHEKAGNLNVFVEARFQRKGIASKLLAEADKRWRIDWEQQNYTEAGAHLVKKYLERKAEATVTVGSFVKATFTKRKLTAEAFAQAHGIPIQAAHEAMREADKELAASEVFLNDKYQVIRRDMGDMIYLSIKRRDRESIHDWRDFQAIKNELVGPENEAVELYPAESRVVDTANQYHLWVFKDPTYRIPFGFQGGRVVTDIEVGGSKQRPR